jgi:FKBP-type peptidyl-prolyl cis-trans isomerase
VTVHYVGTLKSDGSKFDASRDRNQPFDFTIGQGQVIKGWDHGVATMKLGELCQLECSPDMAYGASGSPPKIPPNSTLHFEVELLDFNDKENVSDDGGVRKKTVRPGDGFKNPKFGATMLVVLTARSGDEKGDVFAEYKEASDLTFDDPIMSHGLDLALQGMKRGERSKIYVRPAYGFGPKAGANLNIPPNSGLFYDVELVSWTPKYGDSWEMKLSEKLAYANELKTATNKRFTGFQFGWALPGYEAALTALDALVTAEGEELAQANALKAALNRNIAACHLKLKQYSEALTAADSALAIDSKDAKALSKKGQALYFTNDFKAAITTLKQAQGLDAKNAEVAKFLKAATAKQKKIIAKERAMYGNMF